MPSTYTLNNGIELIATGEQSGTWGDTTNTNLALIDTALDGQVTVTLASAGSSGSPNTLPISDGSASNGRNRLVIFDDGGDLGATAYVQLTPNDAEKIVYIRNDLSGSRSIILFQGTYNASNDYEVPAGTTAVVFFNGGGAGAVAANVFNNAFFDSLRLGSVSVTAILDEDNMASDSDTALATQQSIKAYVDAQVGANNELSEVLANGNTSGANNIQMTTTAEVQFRDTALKINSSVDGQLDIDADVELEITAPTLDIDASTAVTIDTATFTVTGSANVVGDLDVDNLNLNGNAITSTDTNGNIALTPNGTGEVDIPKVDIDGGTIDGTVIGGSTPAAISGTTGTFSGDVDIADKIVHTGDTNTAIRFPAADTVTVETAGSERVRVDSSGRVGIGTTSPTAPLTIGYIGADAHIRVNNSGGNRMVSLGAYSANEGVLRLFNSSDVETVRIPAESTAGVHTYFNAGKVGIGTNVPSSLLDVVSANTSAETIAEFGNGNISNGLTIQTNGNLDWGFNATNRNLTFSTSQTERMRITSSGNVGVGTSSPLTPLQIKTQTNGNAAFQNSTSVAGGVKINAFNDAGSASVPLELDGSTLQFNIAASEKMRITGDGRLFIGTTTGVGTDFTSIKFDSSSTFSQGLNMVDSNASANNGIFQVFRKSDDTYLGFIRRNGTDNAILVNGNSYLALGSGDTERMRIDSSGNLLVGKTTDSFSTQGQVFAAGGYTDLTRAGTVLNVNRLTSDGDIINFYKDGTAVGGIGVAAADDIYFAGDSGSTKGVYFNANGVLPATTGGAASDNTVDLGETITRWRNLYLSGGVYLGGTGAANLLDDYEEGTWTPEIADAASGGNVGSATISQASYTKIGRMVLLTAQLSDIDTTGMTAANILNIRNLPFVSSSDNFTVGSVKSDNLTFQGGRTNIYCQLQNSDDWIGFQVTGSALSETYIDVGDVVSGTTDISFSITYST